MACINEPMKNDFIPCSFDLDTMKKQQDIIARMIEAKNEVIDAEIKKILSNDGYKGAYTKRQLKKAGYAIECAYNPIDRIETFKVFKSDVFVGGFYFDQNDIGLNPKIK